MNMLAHLNQDGAQNQATMSSPEIVDFINEFRKEAHLKPTILRHDSFMAKVPQVLGEFHAPKFIGTQSYGNSNTRQIYIFPKREACLMAMSYSYELQARIFDRMTAMEEALKQAQPKLPQSFAEALQLAADQARQLELQAPKVQYFDAVADVGNLMTASTVGKKLGMSAQVLNLHLVKLKVYDMRHGGKLFTQWFIDKGYGEVKKTSNGFNSSKFTNKGEQWIIEKLMSKGAAA